jgi:hypothetical protein
MDQYSATKTTYMDTETPSGNVGKLPNATEAVPSIVSRSMTHRNTVGTEMIAWTTFDAKWTSSLGRASCCLTYGKLIPIPFCWPIVFACLPCCFYIQWIIKQEFPNTFWILTDREVIVAIQFSVGDTVKSIRHIPLRNVTECYIRKACYDQLSTLGIEVINKSVTLDSNEGYGLIGHLHITMLKTKCELL